MEQDNLDLQNAIKSCWDTRHHCQMTLAQHCLLIGGPHTAKPHMDVMTDCIQICQVAADFMTRGSSLHAIVCSACANICESCADSCETFPEDPEMLKCAEACRACAKACRTTGQEEIIIPTDALGIEGNTVAS